MSDNEKSKKKIPGISYFLIILTAFFLSFSVSAYIYLNAGKLVFSENASDIKEMTAKLGKKDEEITDLKRQLARYKTLYEESLEVSEALEVLPPEEN